MIFVTAVKDLKLRYTTFIGNGNAKTFGCLTELKPYGEDVKIKLEWVGHVQKRIGRALWNLKKLCIEDENGQLVKFKGRLPDNVITAHGVPSGKITLMGWYKL